MIKRFFTALQFLSIIPIRIKQIDDSDLAGSLAYFPLVGLIFGLILTGVNSVCYFLNLNDLSINIILIVLLVILSGGIHLDGLADTADAFLSQKPKEGMLDIMRDSHIGVMGVLSLICILLLKIAFLSSMPSGIKPIALLLMCILGRWSMALSVFLFPYAREEGKAKAFSLGVNSKIVLLSTFFAGLSVLVIWGIRGLLIGITIAVIACIMGNYSKSKIGGITGDTIGMTNEAIEVVVLLCVLVIGRL